MSQSDPFISGLHSISALDEAVMTDLKAALQNAFYEKNAIILRAGQYSERLYFIREGLVKLFSESQGKTFIMRFFPEYSFFYRTGQLYHTKPFDLCHSCYRTNIC